eukprot:scaffold325627_cov72-Tisochrysis_lutea.AAC.4
MHKLLARWEARLKVVAFPARHEDLNVEDWWEHQEEEHNQGGKRRNSAKVVECLAVVEAPAGEWLAFEREGRDLQSVGELWGGPDFHRRGRPQRATL